MLVQIPAIDFPSITTVIQLCAVIVVFVCVYLYKILRDKNKTVVELHKLAKAEDVGEVLRRAKDLISLPDGLTDKQKFELTKHQLKDKRLRYVIQSLLLAIIILLFFSCIILLLINPKLIPDKFSVEHTDKKPVIVGIYPSDIFGINQKRGLHSALSHSNQDIGIIDMDFHSFKEMKSRQISTLLDSLERVMKNENVIAIVGPSITECTEEVLKLIKGQNMKIPVFITSAASKDYLHWGEYRKTLNLFRTGTGIDTRADLISKALRGKHFRNKSMLLIEKGMGMRAFGELYWDELVAKSETLRDELKENAEERHVDVLYYNPDTAQLKKFDSLVRNNIYAYNYLFVLGVGEHFKYVFNNFYRDNPDGTKLPKLGGWMNGYTLNSELPVSNSNLQTNKIFDITDIDISHIQNLEAAGNKNIVNFEQEFNFIHPGLRDEAISYDAAICILEAFKALKDSASNYNVSRHILMTNKTADVLSGIIQHSEFKAISSKIIFNKDGINTNGALSSAIFVSAMPKKWQFILLDDLLDL